MALVDIVKRVGLADWYLELPVSDKELLTRYYYDDGLIVNFRGDLVRRKDPLPEDAFLIDSAPRFLWVTAANALPQGHLDFAEMLLLKALGLFRQAVSPPELNQMADFAHIHANLAQLYADKTPAEASAAALCIHHARETIKTGYFTAWAEKLCREISEKYSSQK